MDQSCNKDRFIAKQLIRQGNGDLEANAEIRNAFKGTYLVSSGLGII